MTPNHQALAHQWTITWKLFRSGKNMRGAKSRAPQVLDSYFPSQKNTGGSGDLP